MALLHCRLRDDLREFHDALIHDILGAVGDPERFGPVYIKNIYKVPRITMIKYLKCPNKIAPKKYLSKHI